VAQNFRPLIIPRLGVNFRARRRHRFNLTSSRFILATWECRAAITRIHPIPDLNVLSPRARTIRAVCYLLPMVYFIVMLYDCKAGSGDP